MAKTFTNSKKIKIILLILLLLLAILARLYLSTLPVSTENIILYKQWSQALLKRGIYNINSDPAFCSYPPVYLYILNFIALIYYFINPTLTDTSFFTLLIKLPNILGDLTCSLLLFYYFFKREGFKKSFYVSFAYLFNPCVILNSSVNGNFDSIVLTLFLTSIIMKIEKKDILSYIFLSLSILTRIEYIIFTPFIFLFNAKKDGKFTEEVAKVVSIFFLTLFLVCFPHIICRTLEEVIEIIFYTLRSYSYFPVNTYGIWQIFSYGQEKPVDNILLLSIFTYKNLAFVLFISFFIILYSYFISKKDEITFIETMATGGYILYIFISKEDITMAFTGLLLLALLFFQSKKFKILYVFLSLILFSNLFLMLPGKETNISSLFISCLNLLLLLSLVWNILIKYRKKFLLLIFIFLLIPALFNLYNLSKKEIYLSELQEIKWTQGWGKAGKNRNLEENRLFINQYPYDYGLATHSPSLISYQLDGNYNYFKTDTGLSKKSGRKGSVIFKIYLDGEEVYRSSLIGGKNKPEHVEISVSGKKNMELIVEDGGDGIDFDHAIWGNAKLYK